MYIYDEKKRRGEKKKTASDVCDLSLRSVPLLLTLSSGLIPPPAADFTSTLRLDDDANSTERCPGTVALNIDGTNINPWWKKESFGPSFSPSFTLTGVLWL